MGIKKRLNPLGIQAFLYEKAKQFRCSSVPLPPANQRSVCRRKSEGIPTIAQFSAKPETEQWWEFLSWQRVKDSNPHIQSQSLLCYLYTNPLYCLLNRFYYTEKRNFVKGFSNFFRNLF